MNRKEYLNKRNTMYDEAQILINKGKFVDAKAKMDEITKLDEEFEAQAKAQANLDALKGKNFDNGIKPQKESFNFEPGTEGISTEYQNQFMNYILKGEKIDSKFKNEVTPAGALMPTQTYQKLIVELEKAGNIYARVFRTNYPAGLVVPTSSVKPTASWVNETEGADKSALNTETISFSGYKLEVKMAFSLLATETSYDIFESQFIEIVKEAIIKAIDKAIISGTGSNQPKGILKETANATINIAKADSIDYKTMLNAEAEVPAGYDEGTVWLMTKKTFFKFLAITDSNGQPIARISAGIDGKPSYVIFGRDVEFTDGIMENYADTVTTDTTFAMLYDLSKYIFNEVMSLSIKRYVDEDTDNTILKAVMICDGKPIDTKSLVKLVKKSV